MRVKSKFTSFIVVFLSLFFSWILSASNVDAATINFTPDSGSYEVGDTVRIRVSVASTSSVNAVSATVKFPSDILTLSSISKAGSVINLWAQEPSYSNTSGTASFEGVILNGYTGSSGTAVTLVFKAKKEGQGTLQFSAASILANDGNGTEILTGKGTSSLAIKPQVSKPIKEQPISDIPLKSTIIKIEEIKKSGQTDFHQRFLITAPAPVKDNIYTIAIDSITVVSWTDDGTHIFQSPDLSEGIHTINITGVTPNGDKMRGFIEFSTISIATPIITDYPTDLLVNQFLVLKGTADPMADIEVTLTNMVTLEAVVTHVQANASGTWTYVSENKMHVGTYSIHAKSITNDGLESPYSPDINIAVKEDIFRKLASKFSSYLSIITPVIALIVLLLGIVVYGIYCLRRLRMYLKKKLSETQTIVSKSFDILQEDADEEIEIFRKIKAKIPLSKDEQTFLKKFKKDITAAQKVITAELKDIEKE